MAYEVVKTIGSRQYRYRVQSERDPQTGKMRNRWTYLGRVAGEAGIVKARAPRPNARLRLLEAAEALLASGDASAVTVDAIASAAGVAHGTFYRYFRHRSAAPPLDHDTNLYNLPWLSVWVSGADTACVAPCGQLKL